MGSSRKLKGGSTDIFMAMLPEFTKIQNGKKLSMYIALRDTLGKINTDQITTLFHPMI